MTMPTDAEIEAARQVLRRLGGYNRGRNLSAKQLSAIGKKGNKAKGLIKNNKKVAKTA